MTFYEKICTIDDIVQLIFNCSNSIDTKTALPCTCKLLYNLLQSKAKFALHQDNLRLELNPNNIQYIPKINCVNKDCDDIGACMGYSTFVYLKVYSDYKIGINKEITRYIPYCKNCTHKYVNYGHTKIKPIINNNNYKILKAEVFIVL